MAHDVPKSIVNLVLRRCQRQGSISAREIREELARAKLAEDLWKDVIKQAGPALLPHRGRYHYVPTGPSRMRVHLRRGQRQQVAIQKAVKALLARKGQTRKATAGERRAHPRVDFVEPVLVQIEEGRVQKLLTRNISVAGLRVIGPSALQGKKVRVWIGGAGQGAGFVVHMLWSCLVGDGLVESGGIFLETHVDDPPTLRLINGE